MPILPVLLWAVLAAASGTSAVETSAVAPDKYEQRKVFVTQFAGEAKNSVSFSRSYDFEALGDDTLLLWESTNRAYLVTLEDYCPDLPSERVIIVNNKGARLTAKFDTITVVSKGESYNDSCRILQIRQVDVQAMKAAEKAGHDLGNGAKKSG